MEIPIKMEDLGVPLFLETSIYVPLTTNPPGNESREPDDPGLTLNPLKTNINGWKIPAMNEDVRILVKMWDFPMLC